ncbi:MAG: proline--tRNA ligase [Elusimicrobia bacterium]|nr:proline--tRNA ligase [Elusimicrobiota bacterium]
MKLSNYFLPTLRQAPSDADNISAKLMFRAAMIRKLASGIYEWLPLGFRVLKKVENIIREEMDAIGAQELWLPVIQPKELWTETGRWQVYGKELLRIKDRKDSEFCFAPTAEEVITNVVRRDINSYRQLPILLYQFGLKFRDEIRPRFGVMRSREFYMKDAYSFHTDEKDCLVWYDKVYKAYEKIFKRCGLKFKPVEAATGAIGGNYSHEFMVFANTGEADIAVCSCGYAANVEKAQVKPFEAEIDQSKFLPVKDVHTPGKTSVEEVSSFLNIAPSNFIKTGFYSADGDTVLALVRGDHEINENKLISVLGCKNLERADEKTYESASGCKVGFAGPIGMKGKIKIIADYYLKGVINAVSGANKDDYHSVNINLGRDYEPDLFADIKNASAGDFCSKCSKPLEFVKGIEVGQTFKLGTKYSSSLKCEFLDEEQKNKPMEMGCYGIGVSRTVAAAIEQNNDEYGIIWPAPIAPFHVYLVTVETEDKEIYARSAQIHDTLISAGIEVLWDERNERPGIKFKDGDLIGLPFRIVISSKTLKDGELEFKRRRDKAAQRIKLEKLPSLIEEIIKEIKCE